MYVDAHTHLDHYDEAQLTKAIAEIEQHSILTFAVAVDVPSYQRQQEIARQSELIVPCFGIHPWRAAEYADHLEGLQPLIDATPMIGEIGLDFHWVEDTTTYPKQRQVFEFFLQEAAAQDKVVNLHTKGAEAEIVSLLAHYQIKRPLIHWYSGPLDVFYQLVALDCYFTIGVELTHSPLLQQLACEIPLNRLLTETDGPGGLAWLTGEIGMPHHIPELVQHIATLREMEPSAVVQTIWNNAQRLLAVDNHF